MNRLLLRWLQGVGRYAAPGILLFLVLVAAYEHIRPWEPGAKALPVSAAQNRVLVSFSIHRAGDESEYKMTYMIFPDAFKGPATFVVHQINGGPVSVHPKSLTIWEIVIAFAFSIAVSVIAWITPRVQRAT